jgi:hypothetical protein
VLNFSYSTVVSEMLWVRQLHLKSSTHFVKVTSLLYSLCSRVSYAVLLLLYDMVIVMMQVCGGLNFQQFIDEQVRSLLPYTHETSFIIRVYLLVQRVRRTVVQSSTSGAEINIANVNIRSQHPQKHQREQR